MFHKLINQRFFLVFLTASFFLNEVKAQSLTLPFFDDFSKPTQNKPDSLLWKSEGVILSNNISVRPPTLFAAVFDGVNEKGVPYDFFNKSAYGYTDKLTSQPIDLSSLSAADTLILSFFWEAKGIGDLPESEDSLLVLFKNKNGDFIKVWPTKEDTLSYSSEFQQVKIAIDDSSFFHTDFQFAFQSIGRQSGPFDTWAIDYVYLNKNRTKAFDFFNDLAVQDITTSLLKNYRSMPIQQFVGNQSNELNLTMRVLTNALDKNGRRAFRSISIQDTLNNKTYYSKEIPNQIFYSKEMIDSVAFPSTLQFENKKAVFKYGYKIISEDNQKTIIKDVDFTRNDSLFHFAALENYFAYDDGTAEIGADVNQKFASIAVRFPLNLPDTLGAVQFNFSPYFKNIENDEFLLQIFSSKNGMPDEELHQQSLKLSYSTTLNGFTEYELSRSIAVKDTFFVSWTRLSDNTLAIGLDKNSPFFSKSILYKDGNGWQSAEALQGAFMVRSVMGFRTDGNDENTNGNSILATEYERSKESLNVFPNPTQGQIYWENSIPFDVEVFNSLGKKVSEAKSVMNSFSIDFLPSGMYIFYFSNKNQQIRKK